MRLFILSLFLSATLLFQAGCGAGGVSDALPDDDGSSSTITLSGSVSDSSSAPKAEWHRPGPFYAFKVLLDKVIDIFLKSDVLVDTAYAAISNWSGTTIKVIDSAGSVLASSSSTDSSGNYSITVESGSNYILRASKGNLVLKKFIQTANSGQTGISINSTSSAIVKILARVLGNTNFGESGASVSDAISSRSDFTQDITDAGNTSTLSAMADSIAANINDHYDANNNTASVGWASSAGDTEATAAANGISDLVGGSIQTAAISPAGTVTRYAGNTDTTGTTNATGASARFDNPSGITTDGYNLYIFDKGSLSVRKIVISSAAVTTIVDTSDATTSADGTSTNGGYFVPSGITTDGENLYVADSAHHVIRKIVISSGTASIFAGSVDSTGTTDATGTNARFNMPSGITSDSTGTNLYVTDSENHTIRKIVIANDATVTTFAGTAGTQGQANAAGTASTFEYPSAITTDGNNLYVADTGNHLIRQIVATGDATVTTLAGTADTSGTTNGTGTAALFAYIVGLTSDGTNLWVTDGPDNHTIRKVVISSAVVTTISGLAGDPGSSNGTSTAARFDQPHGIVTDGTNLYVADNQNQIIRKIE